MGRRSAWIIGCVSGIGLAGLYLAFTSNVGWRELITSVLVGVISTVASLVFSTAGDVRFRFRFRDVIQGWRLLWYAFSGTFEVLHGLMKQLFTRDGAPSFLAAAPFQMGEKESPVEAGRRALAVTYTTGTPNFVVLGLVEEQRLLLYHQIIPGEVLTMTRKLGAGK